MLKNKYVKKAIIYAYKLLNIIFGVERCKKREPLKPMGIGKSIYPEGYIPPVKRTFSDGTVEYYIPIQGQIHVDEALKKMGKDLIKPEDDFVKPYESKTNGKKS